jgi:hypothetical protein
MFRRDVTSLLRALGNGGARPEAGARANSFADWELRWVDDI